MAMAWQPVTVHRRHATAAPFISVKLIFFLKGKKEKGRIVFWDKLGPKINNLSIDVTKLSTPLKQSLKIDKKDISCIIYRKCPLLGILKKKTKIHIGFLPLFSPN